MPITAKFPLEPTTLVGELIARLNHWLDGAFQAEATPLPITAKFPLEPTTLVGELIARLNHWLVDAFHAEATPLPITAKFPLEPTTLVGQTLPVRSETGALNVREGMPTEQGAFPRVSRALSAGTRVRILEVRPWLTTGYQWARVSGS